MTPLARGVAALLLLSACTSPAPDAPDAAGAGAPTDTSAADPARPALPARPAARADTILIEGMSEVTTSQLFNHSPAQGVPFSTYVPEGIRAIHDEDATGGVRFAAAFTGDVEPEAFMHVRFYGPAPEPADVVALLPLPWQGQPAPAAGACPSVETPSWGEAACAFDYTGPGAQLRVGRVIVARHGEHAFHVLTHYPAEYGDGLAPRFQRILDQWRWEDTGDMLTAAAR